MSDDTTWLTIEEIPRRLIISGRSAIDPDVLVAHLESEPEGKALWIVDGGGRIENCFVCGLNVRATMNVAP